MAGAVIMIPSQVFSSLTISWVRFWILLRLSSLKNHIIIVMIIGFSLNNVTPCNILANFYCKILFLYPRFKVDLQKLMDAAGQDSKTKITYLTNLVHVDLVHVDQGH